MGRKKSAWKKAYKPVQQSKKWRVKVREDKKWSVKSFDSLEEATVYFERYNHLADVYNDRRRLGMLMTKEEIQTGEMQYTKDTRDEFYDVLLTKQGGVCAICKRTPAEAKCTTLHVDHCHKSNIVRGLLCKNCNIALGMFDDSIPRLANAITYLTATIVQALDVA